MKLKISHSLIDILQNWRNLHESTHIIRCILMDIFGESQFNERNIRLALLIHKCFAMVGLPKKDEIKGEFKIEEEILTIF